MTQAPSILLVEDSAPLRARFVRLLQSKLAAPLVGEAEDAASAFALLDSQAWDVVVLDISLPGTSGMVVLDQLRTLAPKLPVVMCSTNNNPQLVADSLRRGALGYVAKEDAFDELVPAIECALKGRIYQSRHAPASPIADDAAALSKADQERIDEAERFDQLLRSVEAAIQSAQATVSEAAKMCERARAERAVREARARLTRGQA